MYCRYCGQYSEDDKRFCTNCGVPLDVTDEKPQQQFSTPAQSFRPYTPPVQAKKKGVSKTKTSFFWASKAVLIVAFITFFFPFMSFKVAPASGSEFFGKPLELSGKELIFGVEDSEQSSQDSLRNTVVTLSAVMAAIAVFLPKGSHILSGIASALMILFVKTAEDSYTFNKKKISEWKGLITLEFHPAIYICIGLFITAAVLAFIDEHKRRKLFDDEQEPMFSFGGYM